MNVGEDKVALHKKGICADNISVAYQKGQSPIINGQSIEISHGMVNVFIGPNGSGKSTMLKTLAKQLIPHSGNITIDGKYINQLSPRDFARRLGIMFQENSAPNDLTVEELAYHGRYPHRRLFESLSTEDHEAVEQALEMSGADYLRHKLLNRLSSGQKQLAWIAMLLAQKTDYILLDEPTTFLDLAHQFEIMDLVQKLNRELGCTILMSVHDLNLAARYADRIFVINDGAVAVSGKSEDVLTAKTISEVFGVDARIVCDEDSGCIYCVPLGRNSVVSENILS